ncbi:MAG: arginine repressor [Clostridia bacterium]|nr:arginine repressor [Clostridia bacterium]MBR2288567.1 arginine repressor [Clostridia bacterium]
MDTNAVIGKRERQDAIRRAITMHVIETQAELVSALREMQVVATQATVSRDIREMGLTKVLTPDGVYCYALPSQAKPASSTRFNRMLIDSVLSVETAQNLVVVKTLSGSANMVAEAIDGSSWREVVGTLAGDNTIFLATRSTGDAEKLKTRIDTLIH